MRAIPQRALDFVAQQEAFRAKAYLDVAGIPTVGYGHTRGAKLGSTITRAQGLSYLLDDLKRAAADVAAVVKRETIDDLTENQYAAILSFAFNLGVDSKWTIWKRLNNKQYDQVPQELTKFVNARVNDKMVKVQGLVARRNAEIALWSEDEPGSTNQTMPSSETRCTATPPTASDPTPLHKDPKIMGAALVALTGAPDAIKHGSDGLAKLTGSVEPFAGKSKAVDHALETLAGASAVLAVALVVVLFISKKVGRH